MTTYMPINHKMDEYILVDLHNVTVHGSKNEEITCIHNIHESHKCNLCMKETRHKGIHNG